RARRRCHRGAPEWSRRAAQGRVLRSRLRRLVGVGTGLGASDPDGRSRIAPLIRQPRGTTRPDAPPVNRQTADPAFPFGLSLVLSLILSYPTLRSTMNGNTDITDAGTRYFVALALLWAGVYGVLAIAATFAAQSPRRPTPPPDATRAKLEPRREDAAQEPVEDEVDANAA